MIQVNSIQFKGGGKAVNQSCGDSYCVGDAAILLPRDIKASRTVYVPEGFLNKYLRWERQSWGTIPQLDDRAVLSDWRENGYPCEWGFD